MIRFLIRVAIFLVTAAVGLLVAAWVLPDVSLSATGFLTAVVVFSVAQTILAPFIFKMAKRHASALLGGIGLVSTFVGLLIATFFPGGLAINGIVTWILATVIVWLVTALGTWLLPLWFLKEKVSQRRAE